MWPFSASSSEAESSTTAAAAAAASSAASPAPASLGSTSTTPSLEGARAEEKSRWERTVEDEHKYQDKVYPTTEDLPTCMTLMDEFLSCYALGPQLRNIYRHGTYRDCSYKWADFKYCLSLKSEEMDTRRELWVKRKAEWWAKRRVGASSEDVWNVREKPLENFPPLYADDVPVTPM